MNDPLLTPERIRQGKLSLEKQGYKFQRQVGDCGTFWIVNGYLRLTCEDVQKWAAAICTLPELEAKYREG